VTIVQEIYVMNLLEYFAIIGEEKLKEKNERKCSVAQLSYII